MNRYQKLFAAAMFAALAIVLELLPLPYPKIEFIKIDLVGVPLVLSSLLLGLDGGLATALATCIGMIFTPTGWIGAVMKITATLPMIILFGLLSSAKKITPKNAILVGLVSVVIRSILMVIFNYYLAIPLFFGIPTEAAIAQFPMIWIIIPNVLLGLIELGIAGYLFFKTPLLERLQ